MPSKAFHEVFRCELMQVAERRRRQGQPASDAPPDPAAHSEENERKLQEHALRERLFGLSFSGGGIRSATFSLGVVQRLAEYRLLRHVDYLSTVSGGGYIGAWLEAWLLREGHSREGHLFTATKVFDTVEPQLVPNRQIEATAERPPLKPGIVVDSEPEPIHHLRQYSRYLSPKFGFFTADSWTLVATYLRNLLLNQALLFFCALAAVLVTRCIVWFFASPGEDWVRIAAVIVTALCSVSAVLTLALQLERRGRQTPGSSSPIGIGGTHALILFPSLVAALLIAWMYSSNETGIPAPSLFSRTDLRIPVADFWEFLRPENDSLKKAARGQVPWPAAFALAVVFGGIYAATHIVALIVSLLRSHRLLELFRLNTVREIVAGLASGALVGLLLVVLLAKFVWPHLGTPASPSIVATIGPPLVQLAFLLGSFAQTGLLGSSLSEPQREYWSRISAWTLIYAVVWLGIFGLTLGGQFAYYWLVDYFHQHAATIKWGSIAAWFFSGALGALSGRSRLTRDGGGNRVLEWATGLIPYVFMAGLAVFMSVMTTELLTDSPRDDRGPILPQIWVVMNGFGTETFLWLTGITLVGIVILSSCVDVNLFSLHALYANRLVRCYLGASRYKVQWDSTGSNGAPTGVSGPARQVDPMTGMDSADDLPLRALCIEPLCHCGHQPPAVTGLRYHGPFPIINTALNLVGGSELAWQDRKAESFVLTPLHCGSETTGYALLDQYSDEHLTLGRAMAISGAAASPNMGYHSSPAVTALMAAFNMRLGWWLQNPNYEWHRGTFRRGWQASGPGPGSWLLRELFGMTNDRTDFVYLSDGGHFENLGVYELVRRRCKFVIACDAGADPTYCFDDLAAAIRKCRTDFGVQIDIDVDDLRLSVSNKRNPCHCVVGKIRYSEVHGPGVQSADGGNDNDGILVYIKASLTGDEPADVLEYASAYPKFPQESTVDQFFNESQFESYRALGYHIAGKVLLERCGDIQFLGAEVAKGNIAGLFEELHHEWTPQPASSDRDFFRSVDNYLAIQDALRTDPNLAALSRDIYSQIFQRMAADAVTPNSAASGSTAPNSAASNSASDGEAAPPCPTSPPTPAELHMVLRLLQVMEVAFYQVGLDNYDDHALNLGWVDILRRWGRSGVVRKYWEHVKPEFSRRFQRYFERIYCDANVSQSGPEPSQQTDRAI